MGGIEGIPAASGICSWELPDLALYLVVAVAFVALLLHPGILAGRDFLVLATLSGQLGCMGHIKP